MFQFSDKTSPPIPFPLSLSSPAVPSPLPPPLALASPQLRRLDELCHCPGLLSVSANTNAITAFPPFPPHPLPLQRLLLYHNSIEHVPPERLRPLTSLTCLDLGRLVDLSLYLVYRGHTS